VNETAESDSYAGAKGALRDSIKCLVATFGALLAWTVGGVAVSNLGALPWLEAHFWIAMAGLLTALFFVLAALIRTVRLLQPELLYRGDLRIPAAGTAAANDPALADVRNHLNAHSVQLLPWEFRSRTFNELLDEPDRLEQVIDPAAGSDPADVAIARIRLERLGPYFVTLQSLGSYLWLYFRFNRALGPLGLLSVGALISLALFSVAVKPPGPSAPSTSTVVVERGCRIGNYGGDEKPTLVVPEFAPVRFDLGKADIRADQLDAVAAVRERLRANPGTAVLLRAHTDTTAAAGINMALAC
jgi:hypothetical protein